MDAKMMISLLMGACLMIWVVFCGIKLNQHRKKIIAELNFSAQVKCETCGTEYRVSAKDFMRNQMVKSKSTTQTRMKCAAQMTERSYSYYAKKFDCPHCGKKCYARVQNIDEIQEEVRKGLGATLLRGIIAMIIGCMLITTVFQIPMHFADQAAEKRAFETRQEQYRQFRENEGMGKD